MDNNSKIKPYHSILNFSPLHNYSLIKITPNRETYLITTPYSNNKKYILKLIKNQTKQQLNQYTKLIKQLKNNNTHTPKILATNHHHNNSYIIYEHIENQTTTYNQQTIKLLAKNSSNQHTPPNAQNSPYEKHKHSDTKD